jgi:hypothetical protein
MSRSGFREALLAVGAVSLAGCAQDKAQGFRETNPPAICRPGPYSERDVMAIARQFVPPVSYESTTWDVINRTGRREGNPFCGGGIGEECDCSRTEFDGAIRTLIGPYGLHLTMTADAVRDAWWVHSVIYPKWPGPSYRDLHPEEAKRR